MWATTEAITSCLNPLALACVMNQPNMPKTSVKT